MRARSCENWLCSQVHSFFAYELHKNLLHARYFIKRTQWIVVLMYFQLFWFQAFRRISLTLQSRARHLVCTVNWNNWLLQWHVIDQPATQHSTFRTQDVSKFLLTQVGETQERRLKTRQISSILQLIYHLLYYAIFSIKALHRVRGDGNTKILLRKSQFTLSALGHQEQRYDELLCAYC